MEQSPWEASSHSASQELPNLLWNPKLHYHFKRAHHWSLPRIRYIQPTSPDFISFRYIFTLYSHLYLHLQSDFLPGFPLKFVHTFLISPMRTTCPAHFNFSIWLPLYSFVKRRNYEVPHYCSIFHPPLTSVIDILLGPDMHLSALFSGHLSIYGLPLVSYQSFALIQNSK